MQAKFLITLFLYTLILAPFHVYGAPQTHWDYYQKSGDRSPTWDPLIKAGFESTDRETARRFLERAKILGCRDGLLLAHLTFINEDRDSRKKTIENLIQAEPLLKKQYSDHPLTKTLSEKLGDLYYTAGDYDSALPRYLQIIDAAGGNFQRHYLVGQIYRMQKNISEAISHFEKALTFPLPSSPATAANAQAWSYLIQEELMKLYYDAGDDNKALQFAEGILKTYPNDPTASSYRDNIQMRRYKEKEKKVFDKILEN